MKLVSTNPSDGYAVLGEVQASTEEHVYAGVAAARETFGSWSNQSLEQRCNAIRRLADVFTRREEDVRFLIAQETGRPLSHLTQHVKSTVALMNAYCDMAQKCLEDRVVLQRDNEKHIVRREPRDVVAAICPWNYPLANVIWQCGQALIAGNTIVYKNSEENPLFAELLKQLLEESEFPANVFNVLQGGDAVGRAIVNSDVDMITFTGSTSTGKLIAQAAAARLIPFVCELGGSSPGIVFEDVDVSEFADGIFMRRFFHSGQICQAVKRLIVHESQFDQVVGSLAGIAESKKIGLATDPATELGPLVAKRQVELIEEQVADALNKGATLVTGGKAPAQLQGAYYEPTILMNVTREMRVWREETFGPVLPIVPFSTEQQAIQLANDTSYGLSADVWTHDQERYQRVAHALKAGVIVQNGGDTESPYSPFGGMRSSGIGRLHGEYGFHEMTDVKLISVEV